LEAVKAYEADKEPEEEPEAEGKDIDPVTKENLAKITEAENKIYQIDWLIDDCHSPDFVRRFLYCEWPEEADEDASERMVCIDVMSYEVTKTGLGTLSK
jgi:hypothetical protein